MFKTALTYIMTAIVPVLLATALGFFKLPDSVDHIEYSSNSVELINAKDKLASPLKIQANEKSIEKVSSYSIRFQNTSSKNLKKTQIEFRINGSYDGELITSVVNGPKNYSDTLIKKITETKSSVTYSIEFLNVTKKNDGDFFTASFLFSGNPPDSISPISLSPNVDFVDARGNGHMDVVSLSVLLLLTLLYVAFIVWIVRSGQKDTKLKREKFEEALTTRFESDFSLTQENANKMSKSISELRTSIFNPDSKIKTKIKNWLK